jgi:hypothetical protein
MSTAKFRPSMSLAEINYILSLAELDDRETTQNIRRAVQNKFKIFTTKISLKMTRPGYIAEPRERTEDILDDGADKRARLFRLWQEDPSLVTESQMKQIQLYRYENDLMTPEEEEEFENE